MTSPGSAASSLSGGHGEGRELNMQKTCFYTALQWAKLGVLEAVKIFLVEIFSVNTVCNKSNYIEGKVRSE